MGKLLDLNDARLLMEEHNKESFHRIHAETVSFVMGYFANEYDKENVDFWKVIGMLHDLDFEEYPSEHCIKTEEMLNELGVDFSIIHAVCSHGYGMTNTKHEPLEYMEKVLYAVDELTGLIGAAALMRPSKSTLDMELSSLKKKFKDKKFAAGCSRETISKGAELLEMPLDDLLNKTLDAMKEMEKSK